MLFSSVQLIKKTNLLQMFTKEPFVETCKPFSPMFPRKTFKFFKPGTSDNT